MSAHINLNVSNKKIEKALSGGYFSSYASGVSGVCVRDSYGSSCHSIWLHVYSYHCLTALCDRSNLQLPMSLRISESWHLKKREAVQALPLPPRI